MRVSDLLERMGAGWRPVPELATGTVSHGPFPTAAHAETFACARERAVRVEHGPGPSANIVIVRDWS